MNRDFKGVWIPAFIWLDAGLTAIEKVLIAEIDSFTSRDQDYYKANETIAQEMGCSASSVKRAIAKLTEMGYVERVAFDGRRRALRSKIDPSARSNMPDSQVKWTRQTDQIDPPARSKRTTSNTKKVTKKKNSKEKEVVMPWEGFEAIWGAWRTYKSSEHNFRFKSAASEQAALHNLQRISNDNAETATAIIHQSIANGWKGLFAIKRTDHAPRAATAQDRDKFEAYIRHGSLGPDA